MTRGRAIASLLALTLLIYVHCLGGGFVWDDEYLYLDNPRLQKETIGSAFLHGSPLSYLPEKLGYDVYRPGQVLAHVWLARLTGLQPFGIHLASVIAHAAAGLLVFLLLAESVPLGVAWLAAALFIAHPLHVEAVAWMAAVSEVLAGALMLFSLYALVRWNSQRQPRKSAIRNLSRLAGDPQSAILLALSCLAAIAAFLTKETAYVLPLVAVLFIGRRAWPLWIAGAAAIVFRMVMVGATPATLPQRTLWRHAQVAGAAALQYAKKLVWPWPLAPEYDPAHSLVAWALFAAGCALAGWGAWRMPQLRRGLALIVIALLPALAGSLVFPASRLMQDRFAYLAVLGLAMLIAQAARLRVAFAAALVLLALWSALSIVAIGHWRDPEALWTHTLRVTPASRTAVLGLARWYYDTSRFAEADRVYEHGLRYRPNDRDYLTSRAALRKLLK